ncbi:MAG: 4-hydroxythreonine-4-phosphate dehydrogenase PdxA [Gammaproteobacteria bacterium]|nr:4-hydroxythreonine-4-phosphate dehydrogenase PdxA [Gammaproteobacteria bacterium]MDE2139314.1 4-hydroxythreonine-4-phosphate dehydrogenase PdxA [Gammaproteobacteria bacterium]
MPAILPRIALTTGEPAGIGPDICLALAQTFRHADMVALGDPELLAARARQLRLDLSLDDYIPAQRSTHIAQHLTVLPISLRAPVTAGTPNAANARYVLDLLDRAVAGCLSSEFDAMVTAPVHKGVINEAGIAFTGHTEYLAERCRAPAPVMLLTAGALRVALATTHLPLSAVPRAITRDSLTHTLRVLHSELHAKFGIADPRILVLGLNPHAGEGGHLGREEIEVIAPVCDTLRAEGMRLTGPVAADTAFSPQRLRNVDAVLAMYHDQGLPVLKYAGFGHAVNVTLGLPIIRTSVDHGTALELAATGRTEHSSLEAAVEMALAIVGKSKTKN